MQTRPPDTGTIPPPPSFAVDTSLRADEHEIDLGEPDEEQVLDRGTLPEGVEYLGTYPSIELYLRSQIEPEVSRACAWILDMIDWKAVQARYEEGNDTRLFCESGAVYMVGGV